MPTASGHTIAIPASRAIGTDVYNLDGEKIGKVEDLIADLDQALAATAG